MAGGRPGIEPGSLPYGNILPCGRTASGNTRTIRTGGFRIYLPKTSLNFLSYAINILILIAGSSLWSME